MDYPDQYLNRDYLVSLHGPMEPTPFKDMFDMNGALDSSLCPKLFEEWKKQFGAYKQAYEDFNSDYDKAKKEGDDRTVNQLKASLLQFDSKAKPFSDAISWWNEATKLILKRPIIWQSKEVEAHKMVIRKFTQGDVVVESIPAKGKSLQQLEERAKAMREDVRSSFK